MALLDSVGAKTHKTMGFALIVAFLSLGVISGCGSSNNDSYDFADSGQSDGGLDAVDPNAGIYPNIQVIEPYLSGAIDPIKVQYWDQTYYWGPDSDGNDACFKGTVGIEDSSSLAQETAPGPECPTSLGQVTPCNPAAAADTVASGAVQPAISGCERDGAACTDILVPDITDEVMCESTVRQADPIAAGAAWFQNIDAPGTKGGTASHWWYGTRADKTFDAEDGYGGTQIDYISDATNINIAASGGGRGPTTRVNNIYLCSNKDVVNPAESPDVCTLSSLFGSCGYAASGDPAACKINNIGLVDGAYNVFIRSATPSEGFGGGNPDDGSNTFTPDSNYVMITFDDSYGRPGDAYDAVQSIVGAGAHMTYFATAAFTGDFSTFDEWANTHGNEVANHTVSHIDLSGEPEGSITGVIQGKITPRTKQQWSDADLGYTAVRWKIEIRDMASILANWSNIDSSTIRGFRAPKLQLNVYTFTGYADYIKQSGVASNNYYDSSLSYPRGGVPVASPKDLEPPKKLTAANYCTSKFNIVATNSSELDQCEQILDYGDQVIWEIPMPILPGAQGVMTLPNCEDVACTTPQVFEKFIDEWLETSKTPLLISIHSDELIRDGKGWFAPWGKRAHVGQGY